MSNNNIIMQKILSLDRLLISQQKKNHDSPALKKLNKLIQNIKGVGLIEGTAFNGGDEERYFLIDGASWQKACQEIHQTIIPNFIMWEESDFFTFLESLLQGSNKRKTVSKRR